MGKKKGKYRKLIDHAIGALADHETDIIAYRLDLRRIREKEIWDSKDEARLYRGLRDLAFRCDTTLSDWEEMARQSIPRPGEEEE